MNKFITSTLVIFILFPVFTYGQKVIVKTNILYLLTTTPNIGLEVALSEKFSLSISGAYNPFNLSSKINEDGYSEKSKIKHYLFMPELKYWNCRSFERSFWGVHAIAGHFNMANLTFVSSMKEHRYQGNAYGGGISYGYQWAMGNRWGLEASLGVGYLHLNYDKYEKLQCGDLLGNFTHHYVGPTKIGLSLIYFLH